MASSQRGLPFLPLILSLGLAAGIGWAVHKLTQVPVADAETAARVQTLEQGNAALDTKRLALQKRLQDEPCELAKALGLSQKALETAPGSNGAPGAAPGTASAGAPAGQVKPEAPKSQPPEPASSTSSTPPVQAVQEGAAKPSQSSSTASQTAAGTPDTGSASSKPATTSLLDRIEDATVMVINIQSNGDLRLGTGFFVAPGMVVTNEHVAGGNPVKLLVSNAFLEGVAPAELVAVDKQKGRDYAVLRVRTAKALSIAPLTLRLDARRAQKVSAWGYPSAVSKNDPKYQALLEGNTRAVPDIIYSEGVISTVLDRTPPLIAHTTPLSPGNSGGPLVDAQGHVLGINTLISLDDESYRQTSLSLAAQDLVQFLRSVGVQVKLAESAEGGKP